MLHPATQSFGNGLSFLRWIVKRCNCFSSKTISRASLHFVHYQNSWQYVASERSNGTDYNLCEFSSQVTKLDFSEADNIGTVQLEQICRLSLRGFLQVFLYCCHHKWPQLCGSIKMKSSHPWCSPWPKVQSWTQHLDLSEKNFLEVDSHLVADAFSRFLNVLAFSRLYPAKYWGTMYCIVYTDSRRDRYTWNV